MSRRSTQPRPSAAIFSVVESVLLRPLPYRNAGDVVTVWSASGVGTPGEWAMAAPEFADILEHHRRIFNFEAARNYAYEYEEHHDQVSQALRDTVLTPGRELPLEAYVEAIDTAEVFRRHLDDLFDEVDVLLTPSAAGEAPEGLGSTGDPSFNSIWTLAWTPSVTLPAGTGPKGLPLGIQLVGPRFRDEALLDAAAWVEARLS